MIQFKPNEQLARPRFPHPAQSTKRPPTHPLCVRDPQTCRGFIQHQQIFRAFHNGFNREMGQISPRHQRPRIMNLSINLRRRFIHLSNRPKLMPLRSQLYWIWHADCTSRELGTLFVSPPRSIEDVIQFHDVSTSCVSNTIVTANAFLFIL